MTGRLELVNLSTACDYIVLKPSGGEAERQANDPEALIRMEAIWRA